MIYEETINERIKLTLEQKEFRYIKKLIETTFGPLF